MEVEHLNEGLVADVFLEIDERLILHELVDNPCGGEEPFRISGPERDFMEIVELDH